jgi:hypothetical protein
MAKNELLHGRIKVKLASSLLESGSQKNLLSVVPNTLPTLQRLGNHFINNLLNSFVRYIHFY